MPKSASLLIGRPYLWLGGALLVLAVAGGWLFTSFVTRTGEDLERARLQSLATTTAASFPPEIVAQLQGKPTDLGTAAFKHVHEQLRRVFKANRDSRLVYLMGLRGDTLIFLADAQLPGSRDYSAPGAVYVEDVAGMHEVFNTGQPKIEGPYRDRWGEWVTGLAPISDPHSGKVMAVLGIDIKADDWLMHMARYRWFGAALSTVVTALLAALVVIFSMGRYAQKISDARIAAVTAELAQEFEELTRTQQDLRLADVVVKHTGEGVMTLDADMLIQSVNPAFERITGYCATEVLGRSPRMLISGKQDPNTLRHIRSALKSVGEWEGMLWTRRKNGESYPQETTIDVVHDNQDTVLHYAVLFRDATIQKRLEDRLRELSATDGLTRVANRRMFDEALEREWGRAMREGEPLSLVMADIDNFKHYNDIYGHVAGDYCLQQVAAALRVSAHRSGDVIARYGGEEFVVILPRTGTDQAKEIAEKIRLQIQSLGIVHSGNSASRYVTLSVGVATEVPMQGIDCVRLIERADKALYQAKEGGRNLVVVA